MLGRATASIISTILSYSHTQTPYIKTNYIEGNIVEILDPDQISTFEQLINNLALEYLSEFAAKAKEDDALGKKLDSIHILNTFEFFLSNEDRKTKIRQIFAETRKLKFTLLFGYIEEVPFEPIRKKSIAEFCDILQKNHENGNLLPHLPSFVKKVSKDEGNLRLLIEGRQYQEFFNKVLLED
ncbi:MAG: hypothetical protein KR126chlam6_00188 [Candidatus Anoxychlamydiales bacterium]|nr:hypothetical protein [Candidatus Anoxychlamydiales bacterium]